MGDSSYPPGSTQMASTASQYHRALPVLVYLYGTCNFCRILHHPILLIHPIIGVDILLNLHNKAWYT